MSRDGWILTFTGRKFYPFAPEAKDVLFADIEHALSNLCRFGGHTWCFYSVAQHSVIVSLTVPERLGMHALLHDAAEAYCGDVVRPLKRGLLDFEGVEAGIKAAIDQAFGLRALTLYEKQTVKDADNAALEAEARRFLPNRGDNHDDMMTTLETKAPLSKVPSACSPSDARDLFRSRFHALRAAGL